MEFFETLPPLLKTFWFIAIPVSLIFIIQTILTFIGVDATDGLDADFDSDLSGTDTPFQLFSLRNLINFLLGFSWTGISFYHVLSNPVALIVVSIGVGTIFLVLFFFVIKQLTKLAEDNSFNIQHTINKNAEVYLTIPAHKTGKGKVLISVKGSVRELDAVTESDRIETSAMVKVVRVENELLFVEKV
jgi:membrane-bound ClpP family serine protease